MSRQPNWPTLSSSSLGVLACEMVRTFLHQSEKFKFKYGKLPKKICLLFGVAGARWRRARVSVMNCRFSSVSEPLRLGVDS